MMSENDKYSNSGALPARTMGSLPSSPNLCDPYPTSENDHCVFSNGHVLLNWEHKPVNKSRWWGAVKHDGVIGLR